MTVYNFAAQVTVSPRPSPDDVGGPAVPLLEATASRYWRETGESPAPTHFQLRTGIPFQVGLSGSSAIIIAALRALAASQSKPLAPFEQAEIALAVEVEDLRIAAGPMDRVIQAYEGALHMDFAGPRHARAFTALDPRQLPPLLIAWDPRGGASSDGVHSEIRDRWNRGDRRVRQLMSGFRDITAVGTRALRAGDHGTLRSAMDANFDLRAKLFPISPRDREMVEVARSLGAAAKQCGSGGACLVAPSRARDQPTLHQRFAALGYRTCSPQLTPDEAPER
jgi:glucuronokinase